METKTQTVVKPKLIDDKTRLEAARYVAREVESCSAYDRHDLTQEAWIILESRMGHPFYSSVSYATGDLRRKIYGRDMKEDNFHSKWLLKFGAFDSNECANRLKEDPARYDNKLEWEDVYKELLLFSRSVKKEDAFVVLAHFDDPIPVLKDLRETTTKAASHRITSLRREIKEKYDIDFFSN